MLNSYSSHSPVLKAESLQALLKDYEVYLIDITGVIHDGINGFKEAVDAVNHLILNGKSVVFVSNNPRPGSLAREKLSSCGVKQPFEVLTSGDVAKSLLLTQFKDKRIYHLGAERNQDILCDLTIKITDEIHQTDLVLLTAFLEPDEALFQHDPLLEEIVHLKLPVLCANPDKIAMHGDRIRLCAGTLAERLSTLGGTVIYTGKPDSLIFESLSSFFPHITFEKRKMLMIGDALETDIQGAHHFGIDSLLVLSGNTGNDLKKENTDLESYLHQKDSFSPSFWMDRLHW